MGSVVQNASYIVQIFDQTILHFAITVNRSDLDDKIALWKCVCVQSAFPKSPTEDFTSRFVLHLHFIHIFP